MPLGKVSSQALQLTLHPMPRSPIDGSRRQTFARRWRVWAAGRVDIHSRSISVVQLSSLAGPGCASYHSCCVRIARLMRFGVDRCGGSRWPLHRSVTVVPPPARRQDSPPADVANVKPEFDVNLSRRSSSVPVPATSSVQQSQLHRGAWPTVQTLACPFAASASGLILAQARKELDRGSPTLRPSDDAGVDTGWRTVGAPPGLAAHAAHKRQSTW